MDISYCLCFSVFYCALILHLESVKKKIKSNIHFNYCCFHQMVLRKTCNAKSHGLRGWEGHVSSLHRLQIHILELQNSLYIFIILYPECTEDLLGSTNHGISSSQTKTLFSILGTACRPQSCGLLYKISS